MIAVRVNPRVCSPRQLSQLGRAIAPVCQAKTSLLGYPAGLRVVCEPAKAQSQDSRTGRSFSTTSAAQLRDFFPPKETKYIRQTRPTWPHHEFSEKEMMAVQPTHRAPRTVGDWLAWKFVRFCR